MKRILLIQTAHLGDLILTTPLLRRLRESCPQARIVLLTTATGGELLTGSPFLDEILIYDKRWNATGIRSFLRLAVRLLRMRFDAGIAAQRSFRSGFLLTLSGARRRIGFQHAPGSWAYNERVPWERREHAIERYLRLSAPLAGLAAGAAQSIPTVPVDPQARRRIETLLTEAGIAPGQQVACLGPGATWNTKCWTPEGYAEVAARLAAGGHQPLLIGTARERDLCERVRELCGRQAVNLAGKTGVRELAALLERSTLLVANDSGPAHLATAVATPVVQIFGPTVSGFGYAIRGAGSTVVEHEGLDCRPCHRHGPDRCPLGHHRCMQEIAPGTVLEAANRVLSGPPAVEFRPKTEGRQA